LGVARRRSASGDIERLTERDDVTPLVVDSDRPLPPRSPVAWNADGGDFVSATPPPLPRSTAVATVVDTDK
jgi:hypothetical protein